MRYYLILFLLFSFYANSQGQVLENNPPSVKWKQIVTPGFRVIYPENFSDNAQDLANKLQSLHEPESESMGDKPPKRISIVLQNKNAVSNGFVTLGPRRSEFQTMPPQDYNFIGNNEWLDLLAVHEFRHVIQYQHSKTGFNRALYYLFGENTQAAMAYCAAPPWFWEGDAVATETAFTSSGRGRMPSFNRAFRANLLDKKQYNYHKQHLRSYKDFIPNHYVLGYHFVTHLRREKQDKNVWEDVSHTSFFWPFVPFMFSNSMKIHTGSFLVPSYNHMMGELDGLWTEQLKGLELSSFESVNNRKVERFTDYQFPQELSNGGVIALKSGIADIQTIVQLDEKGKETRVFTPGIMNLGGMLSLENDILVWNEYTYDPRWRQKNYSVIKAYDFNSGEAKTITRKSRYTSAALSPDGERVVAAANSEEGENYLAVIDYNSGNEQDKYSDPDNALYAMARWDSSGDQVVALKISDSKKQIVSIDLQSRTEKVLMDAGDENVGHPVLQGEWLFYNSPYSGIDNIYAKNINSGSVYQVTSSKFGAYNPDISKNGQWIYYNDYTADGFDVVKAPFQPENWKALENVEDRSLRYYEPLVEQEGHEDILANVEKKEYKEKNYSKLGHAFNIHSWGPYATTDLTRAQLGVFSRNVLSTTDISLGYTYDVQEETGYASANVSYQGWFPIIDLSVSKGDRSTTETLSIDGEREDVEFNWKETQASAAVRVPLLLTRSKYHSQLEISNEVEWTKVSDFNQTIRLMDQQANGELITNQLGLSYYRLLKQSTRDINSKWGQSISLSHTSSPFGGDYTAGQTALRATLYFPGLIKNHSFFLRGAFQNKTWRNDSLTTDVYWLRNQIPLPRGYSHYTWEDFYSVSANYTLPLWYPDIALGPILNIKRLRANLFYDYGKGKSQSYRGTDQDTFRSVGADFLFDLNFLRFPPEFSLGVRVTYAQTSTYSSGGSKVEFLLANINF